MKNYKRNSLLHVFLQTLYLIPELISSMLVFSVILRISFVNSILLSILFLVISLIYKYLSWYKTIFYIDDNMFNLKKGIVIKQNININLENIISVDLEQSLLDKLFNIQVLKIETSTTNEETNIRLSLNKNEAMNFKNELLKETQETKQISDDILDEKSNIVEPENIIYKIDKSELLIYSLTKINIVHIILSLSGFLFFLTEIGVNFESIVDKATSISQILFGSILLILITIIIFIVKNYNKYYDFKVTKHNNKLSINYGFSKNNVCSLDLNKICSVKINQTLLQRFLKTATISVSTFGYGDPLSESVVFLNIDKNKCDNILNDVFSHFVFDGEFYDISSRYKIRHKRYKLGYNEDLLYIKTSLVDNKINIISTKALESIRFSQSYFQRKHGLFKLRVSYKSMKFSDLKSLRGLSTNHIANLENILK